MKFATVRFAGRDLVAVIEPETGNAWLLEDILSQAPTTMLELIQSYDVIKGLIDLSRGAHQLADLDILAPIPLPRRNIFCVGKNYRDHAMEFTRSGYDGSANGENDAIPSAPIIFSKVPESVIASGELIQHPSGLSESIDYEAELAIVIGKKGRGIDRASAYDHVWGYTILNDVTARNLQSLHKQWLISKSLDTFCPMGPWIATADEVDPLNLDVQCWVNGELRQSANTSQLIFDIPTLVATLSAGITLFPGDIIATGTPAGVGIGFKPPRFLKQGDEVSIEITGLGRLTNTVA